MKYDAYRQTPELERDLFQSPPAAFRGAPLWAWNTKLETPLLDAQIDVFGKMGMGGFHMHSRTGLATRFMSEEYLDYVAHCVERAKARGMQTYLYDEDRWPSGFAGGLVTIDHPEHRAKYLCFTRVPYGAGGQDVDLNGTMAVGRAENGYLLARYDVAFDADGCMSACRVLAEGERAAGETWYAYVETAQTNPWNNGGTYLDPFSQPAVDCFIKNAYEPYAARFGADFGKAIPSIFTDEPQFTHKRALAGTKDAYEDGILPWTADLPDTFRTACGKDLVAKLPELFFELPGGRISQLRYQFHDHIAERFVGTFIDSLGKWCDAHRLTLTGHMMEEPALSSQSGAVGDVMRAYRSFSLPGIDMLANGFEYNTVKQAASASRQFGREGVMCEAYGVTGWQFDFRGHKLQGDWLAALGVTTRVHHLTWMTMEGENKRDYPPSIGEQSPWHEKYHLIEDHFARLNTALTRGRPVVRVGVIHPVESYWLHFGPVAQTALARQELDRRFADLTDWLLFGSIDFDFISESLLPSQCKAGSAPLRVGEMAYDVVLVPACETLRATTLERLQAFAAAGGRLIFLGDAPRYLDAAESDAPKRLYEACEHIDFSRTAVLRALECERTVCLRNTDGSLAQTHLYQLREDNGRYWLFLARGRDQKDRDKLIRTELEVTIKGSFQAARYDTMTGAIGAYPSASDGEKTVCRVALYNVDSILLQLTPAPAHQDKTPAPTVGRRLIGQAPAVVPVTLAEPNVLLLDTAACRLDGGAWLPEQDILRADNALRVSAGMQERFWWGAQPWTLPPETLRHRASLRFTFQSEVETDVMLALERIQAAEIRFNGAPVDVRACGYYIDRAIGKAPLGRTKTGENEILVELPFGDSAGLEACYLLGDFGVRLQGSRKTLTAPVRALGFDDIAKQGLPFYGGNITYHVPVDAPAGRRILLNVPHYRGALLSVCAGGEPAGDILFAPYELPVTLPEGMTLDITLWGNRANTFSALHCAEEHQTWIGPGSWRTIDDCWTDSYRTFPTGILTAPRFLLEE